MRASQVRQAIIDTVQAITPDHQATADDVFRHVDLGQATGYQLGDRSFYVALESPPADLGDMTDTRFQVGYSLQVFYAQSPGVDDRIGQDVERLTWALPRMPTTYGEMASVSVVSSSVSEDEGGIDLVLIIEVIYRLDVLSA